MKKYFLPALIVVALLISGIAIVKANSSRIIAPASCTNTGSLSTSTALTSGYMTAGNATSTVTCDLSYQSSLGGGVDSMDSAIMLIDFTASSTGATLGYNVEYSQNGSDWFADSLGYSTTTYTTVLRNIAPFEVYTWNYASSTYGTSQINHVTKAVSLKTPTKYVRVKFYPQAGSGAIGVHAQVVGKAERIDK